jgi:hypothetical protein
MHELIGEPSFDNDTVTVVFFVADYTTLTP